MGYLVGWNALGDQTDFQDEQPSLEDLDELLIELRTIITSAYGNHFRRIIAKQMLPYAIQMKSDLQRELEKKSEQENIQRILSGPTCKTCGSLLLDGACERCTREMLRHVQPQAPTESRLLTREEVMLRMAARDAIMEAKLQVLEQELFAIEYREHMDRIYNGEPLPPRPINPRRSVPSATVVRRSRLAPFGQWIRKKNLCCF